MRRGLPHGTRKSACQTRIRTQLIDTKGQEPTHIRLFPRSCLLCRKRQAARGCKAALAMRREDGRSQEGRRRAHRFVGRAKPKSSIRGASEPATLCAEERAGFLSFFAEQHHER